MSTLRRRIKSDRVEFTFRHGKYFLKDASLKRRTSVSPPHTPKPSALRPTAEGFENKTPSFKEKASLPQVDLSTYSFFNIDKSAKAMAEEVDSKVLTSQTSVEPENTMQLARVRADYELVIQQQKAQLVKLQAEVVNLKTLVMALE
ncbi:MAG: hypothetical protein HAW63_00445 [Bdellovibrionaceae bacterium]|nr:hypothetical protein [Pseudobdellovibrionaceae bacterium]